MKQLDLHGIRHGDVRQKVIRFIEDLWGENVRVEIITGNSLEMKNIVKQVLDEYDLEYNDGRFLGVDVPLITTIL